MATANLGITLPTVGGSTDTWGTTLNTGITAIDALFSVSGTDVTMSDIKFNSMSVQETGAGTDTVKIQAPSAVSSSYTLTMPAAVGSANQVLSAADGSGTLAWTTPETGDLTAIVAGAGLTGTALSGPIPTLNVIGTADKITVSADAVTIASGYVGQSSITTLGTIGTGVWNGTAITGAYIDPTSSPLANTKIWIGSASNVAAEFALSGDATMSAGGAVTVVAAPAGTLTGTTLKSTVVTSSLTAVGTIATGVWTGTKVASAYLDDDTAHLSGTQTFSGAKTFSAALAASSTLAVTGNLSVNPGLMAIGSAANAAIALNITSNDMAGTSQYGINANPTFTSDATAAGYGMRVLAGTSNESFTQANTYGILIESGYEGSGSTITNLYGLKIENQASGGTNYAIHTGTGTVAFGANLTVVGSVSKGSGSFKIAHPLPAKADTHHLVHSFIEGPRADLIYRGVAALSGGVAQVDLDEAAGMTEGTWELLCRDPQAWIQNDSGWSGVRGSVEGNTLTIECEEASSSDTVSWMVVAERCDPHMMETEWTDDDGHVVVEPERESPLGPNGG